jgi:lysozyme
MQYSRDGLHLTQGFETCALMPYWDEQGKVWTDGWGNTHGVVPGRPITQFKADADLLVNVQSAVDAVNRLVKVPLTQHQFDALVDFCFNVGAGNLEKSTLLRLLNAGDYDAADKQFALWDMAGGVHLLGLRRRRAAESALFEDKS